MRVFADTNFLISAFATRGLSAEVFEIVLSDHTLIISDYIITELRDKLSNKLKMPPPAIDQIVSYLSQYEIAETPSETISYEIRDPDDVSVLASAIASNANVLITGDMDLIAIADQVSELKVLTPRQFWEILKE